MVTLSESVVQLLTSVLDFFSHKGVLGLITGLLLGAGLKVAWTMWEQKQRTGQLLQLIEETLHYNKVLVEKNLALVGKDLEQLPVISALEPLHSFQPSGADLLWQGTLSHQPKYYPLWLSLKKIDELSQHITAIAHEIFEIKRTIKGETRTEVLRVELIPYLKGFNTLTIMRLTELGLECKKATSLLTVDKEKKKK